MSSVAEYLIEWSDGIAGGFTDPGWAMVSIAENRGIRSVVKIWARVPASFQLYYKPITEDQLERIAFPERFVPVHLDDPAANFA